MKHCFSMISYLVGIYDNSVGPPDPLVLITIITHPLTIAHLLQNRPLVAASPVGSLTHCVKGSLFCGGGRLVDINYSNTCPYALFSCVGGIWAKGNQKEKMWLLHSSPPYEGSCSQSYYLHIHLWKLISFVLKAQSSWLQLTVLTIVWFLFYCRIILVNKSCFASESDDDQH